MEINLDDIKNYAWHLKVQGAFVQQPDPNIYGLKNNEVILGDDATSLYPISLVHQNIGYDTLYGKIYSEAAAASLIGLIERTFKERTKNPQLVYEAVKAFKNAIKILIESFHKVKKIQKKKDVIEFSQNYYGELLKRIVSYKGNLNDIYTPKDDKTYYLLKSCLYPLLETIDWLSPQNKGYNEIIIDYVFFNDEFKKQPSNFFILKNLNSTKTTFEKVDGKNAEKIFTNFILNPFGSLFYKHEDLLAYDVELIQIGLKDRKVAKDKKLVLETILNSFDKLGSCLSMFKNKHLSNEECNTLLDIIDDKEDRQKRIKSLSEIEFKISDPAEVEFQLGMLYVQYQVFEKGIKVSLNSKYGIFGLLTWYYASSVLGNSITFAGKIYGIKLFQYVSNTIVEQLEQRIDSNEYKNDFNYIEYKE